MPRRCPPHGGAGALWWAHTEHGRTLPWDFGSNHKPPRAVHAGGHPACPAPEGTGVAPAPRISIVCVGYRSDHPRIDALQTLLQGVGTELVQQQLSDHQNFVCRSAYHSSRGCTADLCGEGSIAQTRVRPKIFLFLLNVLT
jgi:hypothetical protein